MDKLNLENICIDRVSPFVAHVQLNRPEQRNALNEKLWQDIGDCFRYLGHDPDTRAIVLSGNGKTFCSGLDLKDSQEIIDPQHEAIGNDSARRARKFREKILNYQASFKAIEDCTKPVIVAIHGACIGGGIDLISACDIRICCNDTIFSVKEVDIGLAADTGSLNRLPKICGNDSWVREICLTARRFDENEALQHDLVSKVYETKEEMIKSVKNMAATIATKSPVAVQGTKVILNYSRDHSVSESLNFTAIWNMSQLMTDDLPKAAMSMFNKQSMPQFSKL